MRSAGWTPGSPRAGCATRERRRPAARDHGAAARSAAAAVRGTSSRTSPRSRPTRSRRPTRSTTRSGAATCAALREELGDLLLQVVFHAQMAREAGHFDFGDVVEAICDKLVDRHPHVFGDAVVEIGAARRPTPGSSARPRSARASGASQRGRRRAARAAGAAARAQAALARRARGLRRAGARGRGRAAARRPRTRTRRAAASPPPRARSASGVDPEQALRDADRGASRARSRAARGAAALERLLRRERLEPLDRLDVLRHEVVDHVAHRRAARSSRRRSGRPG